MTRILVTGGCGFIGSNFVRTVLSERPDWEVVNLDKLTYAGRLENLADVAGDPRYRFVKGDICDPEAVAEAMAGCTMAVNFAAETHVDRSLLGAAHFIDTDMKGVLVLLEEARRIGLGRFVQISTDEVYGSIAEGSFDESCVLNPRNPYAASKAGGDRLAFAYWATYGVPVVITRASNNYGPYQYPEKLIPLFVTNALRDESLPLYGDGRNVRDWLHVSDHCRAVLFVLEHGARRRGLQHRRRQRAREHRDHARGAAPARQAGVADPSGRRPHGPRPPLLAGGGEAARAWGGRRWCRSSGGSPRRCAGTPRTRRGGGRSRTTTASSAATTRSSTGDD